MYKAARYIFRGEIAALALIIIGGFLDPAFWFFGSLASLSVITMIMIFLSLALSNSTDETMKSALKKMIWLNILFLAPGIIMLLGLIVQPVSLNIG